jgi:hypothetical protein
VRRFLFFAIALLLLTGLGCTPSSPPVPYKRPPFHMDWQDPVSVMRGFLRAKKRGDWQTAYSACDYDQTLPREERAKIKKKWKQDCRKWPLEYADTFWQIENRRFDGETAVLRLLVSRRDPITGKLEPGEIYEERLKQYKGKWKITNPLAESPR